MNTAASKGKKPKRLALKSLASPCPKTVCPFVHSWPTPIITAFAAMLQ